MRRDRVLERTDSPRQQEHSRHAQSHQNTHNHKQRQVTGSTGDDGHCWDEELRET